MPLSQNISDFLKGLGTSVIPFVALFIIIMFMGRNGGELVWMGTFLLFILILLVSGGFAIFGKGRIALGILASAAIGLVSLVVSCSTVLSTPTS